MAEYLTFEIQTNLYNQSSFIANRFVERYPTVETDYEDYDGYLSGFKKSDFFPQILVVENYNASQDVVTNLINSGTATLSDFTLLDGYGWNKWLIGDASNGVCSFIFRDHYTQGYYSYTLHFITFYNNYAVTSFSWTVGEDSWQDGYLLINDFVEICITQNDPSNMDGSFYFPLYFRLFDSSSGVEFNYLLQISSASSHPEYGDLYSLITVIDTLEGGEVPDPLNPIDVTDPYFQGGTSTGANGEISTTNGGTGTFSYTSDAIDFPTVPSLNASTSGFITIYNPTVSQLRDLADYMWNGAFDINNFKKIFADPMDCILGLSIVPVDVPSTGAQDVCIGNIVSTVRCNVASSQYVWVDCGSMEIKEFYGAYLDYAPYTKLDLYLPFVGSITLNPDEVMNKTINIKYLVDILSGSFMCFIKCGESVLYNFSGSCGSLIPVTGNNWSDMYRAIAQLGISVGAGVISGVGSVAGAVGSGATAGELANDISGDLFSIGKDVAVGSASAVMNAKPAIQRSGSIGGSTGQLGIKIPYLTVTLPRQCLPQFQNKINGYPSYVYSSLSSLSGFTVVQNMHLENMSCTAEERKEITALLSSGVVL